MGSPRVFRGRGPRVRKHMFSSLEGLPFVRAPAQSVRTTFSRHPDRHHQLDQVRGDRRPAARTRDWDRVRMERMIIGGVIGSRRLRLTIIRSRRIKRLINNNSICTVFKRPHQSRRKITRSRPHSYVSLNHFELLYFLSSSYTNLEDFLSFSRAFPPQ